MGHKLKEVLSGADPVNTGLEVFTWSEVWLGLVSQTNWAGFFVGVFLKNNNGLLRLSGLVSISAILLHRLLKPASVL